MFDLVITVTHHGAFAELLFDLRKRCNQCFCFFGGAGFEGFFVHDYPLSRNQ